VSPVRYGNARYWRRLCSHESGGWEHKNFELLIDKNRTTYKVEDILNHTAMCINF
jgi:hypothetical protein